jgi:hypothetical protein
MAGIPSASPKMGINPYAFVEQLARLIELQQGMGRHAYTHERRGFDAARLSVQADGKPLPMEVTINFTTS